MHCRQPRQKAGGEPESALAEFIGPKERGLAGYLGAFAVTAGIGAAELATRFEKAHDDYNAIMVKALADRLSEALAEWMHKQARDPCVFAPHHNFTPAPFLPYPIPAIRPPPPYPLPPAHT